MVIRKVEIESICSERRSMSRIIAGEENNKICEDEEKRTPASELDLKTTKENSHVLQHDQEQIDDIILNTTILDKYKQSASIETTTDFLPRES